MEDVDPDPGVKKWRKLYNKWSNKVKFFDLQYACISIYWYRYQYIFYRYPNLFEITETSGVLKIIEVTSSLQNLSFLDPDQNGVVLDPDPN